MKKALALAAALLVAPPAFAQQLQYSASIAGLPLGTLDFAVTGNGEQFGEYGAKASFRMVPLLRQVLSGGADADSRGTVAGGRYLPRTSLFRYDRSEGERRLAIAFDEQGAPIDLRADPPLTKRPYGMSLGEAAGAVDPATAIAVLIAPRALPCALSIDVFDGSKRHRIKLTDTLGVERGVVTCAGVYERVKGFKDKYMAPDRRTSPFSAQLAREGTRWIPLKITSQTKFGPASATLKR